MDLGMVGFDNLVSSSSVASKDDSKKHKWCGSRLFKQYATANEEDLREFKLAKTSSCGEEMLKIPRQTSNNCSFIEGQQMLSFSAPSSQNVALPYFQHTSSSFGRSSGYDSTGLIGARVHGALSGVRGPFTPSQWMELEHQALIYKYIMANVPVPSYLLNPIRKALESAGFSAFSGLRSNALGWGAFHLGFSNTDPEPGRCRRTDGKKWRCSRDAVADQKYCERHMNRGRHRSRKPVEGQSGHSASGTTSTNAKPTISSALASLVPAGGVSNDIGLSQHQLNDQQVDASKGSRNLPHKDNTGSAYQHVGILSMESPKIGFQENQYSILKQQSAYDDESCQGEFGFVSSDSLINPLNRSSSVLTCRNYSDCNTINSDGNEPQHSLRQFMDEWPKNKSAQRSSISWLEPDPQPDTTQLSISIPVATSNFISPRSSPTSDKHEASSLTSSREHQATEVGLGVGFMPGVQNQRETNWIPISWEPSIGGPLGEVLHNTNNGSIECKNDKALNLIEGWDSSPQLASSPTGVLQSGAFGSLSNSSAGSSPRAETKKTL